MGAEGVYCTAVCASKCVQGSGLITGDGQCQGQQAEH